MPIAPFAVSGCLALQVYALPHGRATAPGSGLASKEGQWIIEGYGVDPDIEVENDPKSEIEGRDPQLERGITEVMAKLKTPVKLPAKPAGPVKTIR